MIANFILGTKEIPVGKLALELLLRFFFYSKMDSQHENWGEIFLADPWDPLEMIAENDRWIELWNQVLVLFSLFYST